MNLLILLAQALPPPAAPADPDLFDLASAMLDQVLRSPAALLLIAVLSVIAWLIEISRFDSRWIPWVCVVGGALTYWMFAARSSVPASFPYPWAVLVANGIICGFIAYAVHGILTTRLLKRFQPPPQNPS